MADTHHYPSVQPHRMCTRVTLRYPGLWVMGTGLCRSITLMNVPSGGGVDNGEGVSVLGAKVIQEISFFSILL